MLRATRRLLHLPRYAAAAVRSLSQNETSTALRPFYLSVHPDLFTQFPEERLVNEESLKILNNHVESLLNDHHPLPEKRLPFYVRDQQQRQQQLKTSSAAIRLVNIPLGSDTIHGTVSRILQACNLPTQYLDTIKPRARARARYRQESSIPNPELVQPKPPLYLSTWIRNNISRARDLQEATRPVLDETDRMRSLLCSEYGLVDVRWESKWGMSNYHACLKRLHATAQAEHGDPWVRQLRGHTLVFGSETGVTALGEIVLSSDDVPQDWLTLLAGVRRYDTILEQLPQLEKRVSSMLNGISICRRPGGPESRLESVMADRYSRHLAAFLRGLMADTHGTVDGDLQHLQLAVVSGSGPLAVTPSGELVVPCTCPGSVARNFINHTKLTAARNMRDYLRDKREEEMIVSECRHVLDLQALAKDDQISHHHMRSACLRLVHDVRQVGVALTGLRLRVSQFYSVMSSGEMVIPWDWKGHDT